MIKFAALTVLGVLSSAHSVAAWNARFGVLDTLVIVPGDGVTSGGVGCGLIAEVYDNDKNQAIWYSFGDSQPTDACPAADSTPFCERWGCPITINWSAQDTAPYEVTVESDNGDKSIHVTAAAVGGGTWEGDCGMHLEDISGNPGDKGGQIGWIWECSFT
ncbi:hypothetical protein M752DRAFT_297348 [Aspergillus phoenicis ATCC 13157]|uniref:Uncharacterized protein n=1 Tax=Aspergillus phoenicis ATCC 13157 TaxID=1353007 RepID=A0A370P878_ASPPH|nr:hypothetical protein M752DRAFT_297348 [Aspergillus phoenicis ATCC 13157]